MKAPSPRMQLLSGAIIAVVIAGIWLHVSVIPQIAWLNGDSVATGWQAVRSAWPVHLTAGALAGLLAIAVGLSVGETVREQAAEARAAEAEAQRALAEERAENASQAAEQALSQQWKAVKEREERAREREIAAETDQKASKRQQEQANQRVTTLEAEVAKLTMRLEHSIAATRRRQKRIQRLKNELAALKGEVLP